MTAAEMLVYFRERYNLSSNVNFGKQDDELYLYLNAAVSRFIKTRVTGNNPRQVGFQGDQKRIDDLRTLVKKESVTLTAESEISNGSNFPMPSDYYIGINCIVNITNSNKTPSDYWTQAKTVDLFTLDDYLHTGNNKPIIDNPLISYYDNKGLVIYDPDDTLAGARLMYVKEPAKISGAQDCDLPEHTHEEVVEIAIKLAIEGIESQRYQTSSDSNMTLE